MKNYVLGAIAFIVMLCLTPTAFADSFTLGGGYTYTSLNGQYVVGAITGSTLDGVPIGPVFCDDSGDVSHLGTTWTVDVNPLTGPWITSPLFAADGVTKYEEAFIFKYEMTLPANANQYDQNLYQAAIWDLFNAGTGTVLTGLPSGADDALLAWVPSQIGDFNYDGAFIITPHGSDNQEFGGGGVSPVPEPASWSLAALSLLLLGGGYKFRQHRLTARS